MGGEGDRKSQIRTGSAETYDERICPKREKRSRVERSDPRSSSDDDRAEGAGVRASRVDDST